MAIDDFLAGLPDWEKQAYKIQFFSEIDDGSVFYSILDKAQTIINDNRPPLYKYREDNDYCLDCLENNKLHLSSPNDFNDPYDSAFSLNVSEFFESNISKLAKYYGAATHKYVSEEDIRYIFNQNPQMIDIASGMYVNTARDILRVCSFSTSYKSILMWSHYANQHKGVCFKYEFEKSDAKNLTDCIYPVIYTDKIFDIISNLHNLPCKYQLCSLIKSTIWKYEQEWRFTFQFSALGAPSTLPMPLPKAIYLGTLIDKSFKEKIINVSKKKGIPIYQMNMNRQEFKLSTELINLTPD